MHAVGQIPAKRGPAGDVDDRPAAGFLEMENGIAAKIRHRGHVDLHDAGPILTPLRKRRIGQCRGHISGIVDQTIKASLPRGGLIPKGVYL